MSEYRRYFLPGGTFFFTQVTQFRVPILGDDRARNILGDIFRECQQKYPFEVVAIVLLPDHLHTIWSLPRGDQQYALRWSWIKSQFTRRWLIAGGTETSISKAKREDGRRGVWQRRYWEHTIRCEEDLIHHANYIHYNPVKHGYVSSPETWLWSSFHRYVSAGEYEASWGSRGEPLGLPQEVGE